MSAPTFSVVINTVDRAASLGTALDGLRAQRFGGFEVVVVVGPTGDATAGVIRSRMPGIKVARCAERNLGMSRNIGIAMSAGEVVAFLDDDAVPEPGWLDALSRAYGDPRVGCVGGPILDHTGVSWQVRLSTCDRLGRTGHPASLPRGIEEAGPGAPVFACPTGANASFRRDALVAVGGFDENIAWFLDETDATLRVLDAGWKVLLTPGAVVHHKYAPSGLRTADRVPRTFLPVTRSTAYFAMRHGEPALGRRAAVERIAREVSSRLTDVDFLRMFRAIDPARAATMKAEVVAGAREGIRLAGQPPATRAPGGMAVPLAPFLAYPRPSAEGGRLRICFVSQDYPPGKVGGIGIWTANLARSLAAAGHEVSVVCQGSIHAVDFEDGVWVHRIVPRRMPPGLLADIPRPLADRANSVAAEVRRIAGTRGLDVVSAPIWDLEGEAVRREGVIPTVTSLHTTYRMSLPSKPDWTRHRDYFEANVLPVIRAEDRIVAEAGALLANSEAIVRDVFAGAGIEPDPARYRLVPHGLADAGRGRPAGGDGTVEVLYVGRLERRKGIDVLVEAADRLLADRPGVRLTVIGDETNEFPSPWAETVASMAAEKPHMARVTFKGFVTDEELRRAYAGCDVFVAPSRYESFGLIFLEAMMQSKPCVGTIAGGIPEVVEDGVTGFLVPVEDAGALSAAMGALVDDAGLAVRMGAAGRLRYERTFTTGMMGSGAARAYRAFAGS